jgi:hypothetical protein
MAGQSLFDSLSNNTRKFVKEGKGKMRTNIRKFSLVLTALVLVLTLGLVTVVPVLACDCDNPMWVFFNNPALRAEITSPQEGECIAVGSTFTVVVTVYNESDNCACAVDVDCRLNGGWPAGEYRDNLSFAAGETQHKSTPGAWPGDPMDPNSSMVFTWQVVCTGLGDARIRINLSAAMNSGEETVTVTFHQVCPDVSIDIKPSSDPNSINLKSKGVVPVAVLTTGDFDASTTDPGTVVFAGASPLRWALEDVDNDGDMDMLFHFKTQELDLDSTEATLTGDTSSGCPIIGTDTVNIVPTGK